MGPLCPAMMKDRSTGQYLASGTQSDPHRDFAQRRADFLNAVSGGSVDGLCLNAIGMRRGAKTARRGAGPVYEDSKRINSV